MHFTPLRTNVRYAGAGWRVHNIIMRTACCWQYAPMDFTPSGMLVAVLCDVDHVDDDDVVDTGADG